MPSFYPFPPRAGTGMEKNASASSDTLYNTAAATTIINDVDINNDNDDNSHDHRLLLRSGPEPGHRSR